MRIIQIILLCTCLSAYSQNNFADIKREVNTWLQSVMSVPYNKKAPISIDFATQKYSIDGIMTKGRLCEGTIAKFYDTSSLIPNLLLEGKVTYQVGRLIVKGIRYVKTETAEYKSYGTFYVFNIDDFTMNYKPKKAGRLRIERGELTYLEGLYEERPVIIKMKGVNSVYVGPTPGGKGYSFLSAVVPDITLNEDSSFDIYQILLSIENDVIMRWENGIVFKGKVKPTSIGNGLLGFYRLDGQHTRMNNSKITTVSHENGNIIYTDYCGEDDQLISMESYLVKDDGNVSEADYWNLEKILEHCYLAKRTYRNGNSFEGVIKAVFSQNADSGQIISTTATKGVFKYPNGDRFEGDVSSKSVGPFFIDGTTFFADGSKEKSNWFKNFKLANNQWEKVYECENPSSARTLAHKFMHSNNYPEYEYADMIQYFAPSYSKRERIWDCFIIYDKANKCYICKEKDNKETILVFAVDNRGYRRWERVYKDGLPTYINEYTWYSNGVVESIKSFSYDTKKIYLSCNFFSDGKLRSAYQFGIGNKGENILRKSKESHPKLGGYTCKLYDLNGNFERSIDWNIGFSDTLFGKYVQEMAPSHFSFSELKPIE